MSQVIKKYKLFTLVPLYSFTRKYVEIDIAHLRSLILKVQRESQTSIDILNEDRENNKHERATLFFSQVFDFELLRLDIN